MAASFIYGLSCNYMPVLGFLILNRTIHFHIPLFDIEYKPWRLYLLLCGLPSLICAIILLFLPESPKFTFSKVCIFYSIYFIMHDFPHFCLLLIIITSSFLLCMQTCSQPQGDEAETLNILRHIHRINNPKDAAGYNVTKVVEDVEFIDDSDTREMSNVSENRFVMLWKQTCLLFSNKNAKKMVIVCLMQCGLFGSCHGLYMFFPEIVDKVFDYQTKNLFRFYFIQLFFYLTARNIFKSISRWTRNNL